MKKLVLLLAAIPLLFSCVQKVDGGEKGKGDEKADLSNVILSEINGAEDFIELYNAGDFTVSLNGAKIRRMRLKDGLDDEQTLWTGQSVDAILPGEYLCLKFENTDVGLKRNFSGKKNALIWLQDADKNVISEFKRGSKSLGWNQIHMQRCQNYEGRAYSYSYRDGSWGYAEPTPGKANAPKVGSIDEKMMYVVINEIDLKNSMIELYNSSDKEIDLLGYQLRWSRLKGGESDNKTIWDGDKSFKIAPKGFAVLPSETDLSPYIQKNIHIRFRDAAHTDFAGDKYVFDEVKRGGKGSGWTQETMDSPIVGSMARIPDGIGDWYLVSTPTIGKTNGTVPGKELPEWEGY